MYNKKNPYPPIFDLCHCNKCNEIVWGGKKFISGHNLINIIRQKETYEKISNSIKIYYKNHPEAKKILSKQKIGYKNPMKNLDIVKKNKETFKKNYKTENHPNFGKSIYVNGFNINRKWKKGIEAPHYGMKHSNESRKKNSESHKGKLVWNKGLTSKIDNRILSGKENGRYGKPPKHGKRYYYYSPLQNKICFRSSWELAYAKYLDSQKILWYYEIETFELSNEMTYTPDFFLIKDERFVEIKGYTNKIQRIKIDKFKKEYPFSLDILYKDDLIKLGINIK